MTLVAHTSGEGRALMVEPTAQDTRDQQRRMLVRATFLELLTSDLEFRNQVAEVLFPVIPLPEPKVGPVHLDASQLQTLAAQIMAQVDVKVDEQGVKRVIDLLMEKSDFVIFRDLRSDALRYPPRRTVTP